MKIKTWEITVDEEVIADITADAWALVGALRDLGIDDAKIAQTMRKTADGKIAEFNGSHNRYSLAEANCYRRVAEAVVNTH